MANEFPSPMDQAVAQSEVRSAISKFKAQTREMLANRHSSLWLAGEDVGGLLVGGGTDIISRYLYMRFLKLKPGEAAADYHKRFDLYTGTTSAVIGGLGWAATLIANHRKVSIAPLSQGSRTASTVSFTLGANRLISTLLKIPA